MLHSVAARADSNWLNAHLKTNAVIQKMTACPIASVNSVPPKNFDSESMNGLSLGSSSRTRMAANQIDATPSRVIVMGVLFFNAVLPFEKIRGFLVEQRGMG